MVRSKELFLTERQKQMLRVLIPGLQDGSIESEWTILHGDDQIMSIFGLNDDDQVIDLWVNKGKDSDFLKFQRLGLMQILSASPLGRPEHVVVDTGLVIATVESGFRNQLYEPQETFAPIVNVNAPITSSNVNIASNLTNSQQTVSRVVALDDEDRAKIERILTGLNQALEAVEDKEVAQRIAKDTDAALKEMADAAPNPNIILQTLDSLKRAAESINPTNPKVLHFVMELIQTVTPYLPL